MSSWVIIMVLFLLLLNCLLVLLTWARLNLFPSDLLPVLVDGIPHPLGRLFVGLGGSLSGPGDGWRGLLLLHLCVCLDCQGLPGGAAGLLLPWSVHLEDWYQAPGELLFIIEDEAPGGVNPNFYIFPDLSAES